MTSKGRWRAKIHLKRLVSDHLALCKKLPGDNWVLEEVEHHQVPGMVCRVCSIVAAKLVWTKTESPWTQSEIRTVLKDELADAKERTAEASEVFLGIMAEIPSGQPDGTQRIHDASRELSTARKEMMKAHTRLGDYIERGVVPEDLKRRGSWS